MSTRRFQWMIRILLLSGFFVGYRLSSIQELRTYKLLNLAGQLYAFCGVLVLSETLAGERWNEFCVKTLAPLVSQIHTFSLLGAFVGSVTAWIMRKPSWFAAAIFSISFWGWSTLALMFFDEIVAFPQLPFVQKDVETRRRWFGFFLVLAGVGVQLIATVMDLIQ